jgi:excisionase family DNA binding protein
MATAKRELTDHAVQRPDQVIDLTGQVTVHKLMTVREVAVYLQMSTDFVYENANEIGGVKLGGAWRFRLERVDAYLDSMSIAPRRRRRRHG